MSFPSDKLIKWIQARLTDIDSTEDENRAIVRFELFHTVDGEGGSRVHTISVTTPMNVQDTARDVWMMAEADSETRSDGTPQRYTVAAFNVQDREPAYQFPFLIRPNPLNSSRLLGQSTEPPTEKGVVANILRHNESLNRMLMLMTDATAGKLAAACNAKDERIADLESKMVDTFKLTQELLDKHQERELERAAAIQRAKRTDQLVGAAIAFAPALLGAIVGKINPAAKQTGRDEAFKALLGNMSEKEAMGVMGALEPANQAALMQIFQSFQADFQREEAAKPEILREKDEES